MCAILSTLTWPEKMEERIDFQNSEMLKNMTQGNSYHLNSN